MAWTINSTPVADLKLCDMTFSRRSLAAGVANLTFDRDDIPAGLEYRSTVIIRQDGDIRFSGVAGIPNLIRHTGVQIPIYDPWWYLENCPMLFSATYSDGAARTTAAGKLSGDITAVINAIVNAGPYTAAIALGTVDLPAMELSEIEFTNRTRAQALIDVVSKCPGVFTCLDATQIPAQLHILKADSATIETLTIDRDDAAVASESIALRSDLLPVSVGVAYIRDREYTRFVNAAIEEENNAPEFVRYDSTGGSQNAIGRIEHLRNLGGRSTTIQWRAALASWTTHSVKWHMVNFYARDNGATNWLLFFFGIDIWRGHLPGVYSAEYSDRQWIAETIAGPGDYDLDALDSFCFLLPSQKGPPKELLYDAANNPTGLELVSFTLSGGTYSNFEEKDIGHWSFTALCMRLADMPSSELDYHTRTINSTDFESAPSGNIAQLIYEQNRDAIAEGAVTAPLDIAAIPIETGKITITDGETEIGTGLIQSLTYDAFNNLVSITFGPPQHLQAQDFAALQNK